MALLLMTYTGRWSREGGERRPQVAAADGACYQRYNERGRQHASPRPRSRTYVCTKCVL